MFRATNPRVKEYQQKIDTVNERFKRALNNNDINEVSQFIVDLEIAYPVIGSRNWTDVRTGSQPG